MAQNTHHVAITFHTCFPLHSLCVCLHSASLAFNEDVKSGAKDIVVTDSLVRRREADKLSQALPWEVLRKFRERIKIIPCLCSWCFERVNYL